MAMIETKQGLDNLDEICATSGLDAVYIGPSDLSLALDLKPRGIIQIRCILTRVTKFWKQHISTVLRPSCIVRVVSSHQEP